MAKRRRRRNPATELSELPIGEFIPVQAIRMNEDGKLDIKVSDATAQRLENPRRRNIAAGFVDEDGIFHPIRASFNYAPGRVGEKGKAKPAKRKRAKAKRKR